MKTESVDYLILAELSSKPFYVLRRLADLRCQTSRVSHLRIFLINIFHLAEGLAEWESNKRRKGKWLLVKFGSLRSTQFKQKHSSRLHAYYSTLTSQRWLLILRDKHEQQTDLWSTSFCNSLQMSSSFCCNLFLRCSGGRWEKSSVTVVCKSEQQGWRLGFKLNNRIDISVEKRGQTREDSHSFNI